MKLEEMDDFTLNCRLANLLGLYWTATPQQSGSGWIYSDKWEAQLAYKLKDYCTDWNATMPLAVKNKISLDNHGDEWFCTSACSLGFRTNGTSGKNPLRAIVVCLIKKLESV